MRQAIPDRKNRQRQETGEKTESALFASSSVSNTKLYHPRAASPFCLRADYLLPRPPLVTIVDDDVLVRRSLTRLVKSVGFKVEAFVAAEDFLLAGNLHDTRCLILDVRLPGMSGLDLQRRVAAHRHISIIFVSAHDQQKTREQALQAGAVAFLNKPFSEEALLSGVHFALQSPHPNELAYEPVISRSQR